MKFTGNNESTASTVGTIFSTSAMPFEMGKKMFIFFFFRKKQQGNLIRIGNTNILFVSVLKKIVYIKFNTISHDNSHTFFSFDIDLLGGRVFQTFDNSFGFLQRARAQNHVESVLRQINNARFRHQTTSQNQHTL